MTQHFDTYAAGLQRAHEDMARIRQEAAGAGLQVEGDLIHERGPPPPAPGSAPVGDAASPQAVTAHNDAVTAQNAHAAMSAAFTKAQQDTDTARRAQKFVNDTISNVAADLKSKYLLNIGDLAGGAGATLTKIHSSMLLRESARLADDAAKFMTQATTAAGADPGLTYRDVDTAKSMSTASDDMAIAAADAEKSGGKLALKAGGLLAAAGVVYDVAHGKPVGQAVVSGAGGFAASVAAGAGTGALIGSFVPVPGVGTAVGAVVGAAVGVFTSGAIDSIYQNGIGAVGDAIESGANAVANTGKTIGHAAVSVSNAIGDVLDDLF